VEASGEGARVSGPTAAPFSVRDWLAEQLNCPIEELVPIERSAAPDWGSRRQCEYTRNGAFAGRVIVTAARRHGSESTRATGSAGHRQVTASWPAGSASFRIAGDVEVTW